MSVDLLPARCDVDRLDSATLARIERPRAPDVVQGPSLAKVDELPSRHGGEKLLGRRCERNAVDHLLEQVRGRRSGVLVLRGEPGVGKTALLQYAAESASALRVVRAMGVESEMELAFAALHQLCSPMFDRLDQLPSPQRDALATTFGLRAGAVPDRFLVGLAVLSLLSEAAAERPLLCVVDDAQWLDRASAQVLAFVARRLQAESIVLLLATREPSQDFRRLPELVVNGLRDTDAHELLRSAIPGRLDDQVLDQFVAETGGNPLALLELPRGLTPEQLAGGFGLPVALGLPDRIEQSFQQRLEALPEDTRRVLLVAASDPTGNPALLWRTSRAFGVTRPVLEPAESAGLLDVGARVRFRHPLVRSAVYGAASPEERREVHGALAEATDADDDPDRRAWHRAQATCGPDEEIAAELERSAARAEARGGPAAAAAFLEQAAGRTLNPARRAQRALAAAQAKHEAGAQDAALHLLRTVERGPLDELGSARVDLVRARIALAGNGGGDAPALLLHAAKRLERLDLRLARDTYLEAVTAAESAGRFGHDADLGYVARVAHEAPPPTGTPRASDLLLDGLTARFTDGYAAGGPILTRALGAFRCDGGHHEGELRWIWLACRIAADLWDYETWDTLATRQVELVRDVGAMTVLPLALSQRIGAHTFGGELGAAELLIDELQAAAEATSAELLAYGRLVLAAWQARDAEAGALVEATMIDSFARGDALGLVASRWASAVVSNGLGRYDDALAAAERAAAHPEGLAFYNWSLSELVEAGVRSGQAERALAALDRLAEVTRTSGTDWALGIEARSRALMNGGQGAEGLYREAIQRLGRSRVQVELGRAHLLYGEWLRRERRRRDARDQLRTALEMFTSMGTEAFARRAERELSATGESVRKRTVETRDELTTQEAQVARLARDGLSNAEIGGRLFISPHTVAYHLRKVFSKLDIASRSQLNRVLPERTQRR